MATPREIRRLAFQALFQLDARGEQDSEHVRGALAFEPGFDPREVQTAFERALAAYQQRAAADAAMQELAPTWPAYRQAAVDRAILRLAHYEMTSGLTNPKIAVNEAVELAKEFSTDKSPAFVNGLLDKVLKQVAESGTGPARTTQTGVESPDELLS